MEKRKAGAGRPGRFVKEKKEDLSRRRPINKSKGRQGEDFNEKQET